MKSAIQQEYEENGFVIIRNVFGTEQVRQLLLACDQLTAIGKNLKEDTFLDVTYFNLMRPCNPFAKDSQQQPIIPGQLRRVTYPYGISPVLNELRTHPNLIEAVARIFESNLVQIVNQVNFSPPRIGTGWGWHQDYRFRHRDLVNPLKNFVQTVTAIDPCHEQNGGLRLIPKSHLLGELTLDANPDDAEQYFNPADAVTPNLEPGDTVFFNPLIIHGSGENRSQQMRRVFINGYARSGVSPVGMPVMIDGQIIRECSGQMEYESNQDILPLASKY